MAEDFIMEMKSSEKYQEKFGVELSKTLEAKNLTTLYFASPPDEKPLLKIIEGGLSGQKIVSDQLLIEFLKEEFQNCVEIKEDFNDVIWLMEQELCYLSTLFIYSCFSTWR